MGNPRSRALLNTAEVGTNPTELASVDLRAFARRQDFLSSESVRSAKALFHQGKLGRGCVNFTRAGDDELAGVREPAAGIHLGFRLAVSESLRVHRPKLQLRLSFVGSSEAIAGDYADSFGTINTIVGDMFRCWS